MPGAASALVRVLTGAALVVAAAAVPVAAQEAAPTTVPAEAPGPTSTTVDGPTAATPVAPADPAPEGATVTADDEASYRAALASLSAAPSGPNTIQLVADLVVDDGTDPTYTGTADLVIDGNGHTLDGAGANRLLVVESPDADLALSGITVRGGRGSGDGGAVWSAGGAGVSVAGATFADNHATGSGGAIAGAGNVDSDESTFEGNEARDGDGGAIAAGSTFPIERSTFAGNAARRGGALSTGGESAFLDVTVTANTASERGGGIRSTGRRTLYLIYGTLAGNTAPVAANLDAQGLTPRVVATAIAGPGGGGRNCVVASVVQAVTSFSDDVSCGTTGWLGTGGADALLGPLQDNGGPTETLEPLPESPLVDAIDPLRYWGGPTLGCTTYDDQRGVSRPQDGNGRPETGGILVGPYGPAEVWCDIGAVERETPPTPAAPLPVAPRFTG